MNLGLKGRVAVVTGGDSDTSKATAQLWVLGSGYPVDGSSVSSIAS